MSETIIDVDLVNGEVAIYEPISESVIEEINQLCPQDDIVYISIDIEDCGI